MTSPPAAGRVYLVGAGPGALDLVTLRARELVGQADVLVYDYLCNPQILRWARPSAEQIYVGKSAGAHTLTQEEINDLLIAQARSGRLVVRLKGGDPYVFGRGGEEAQALVRAGLAFEEVPGVTSAIAAPAYAGIPVTHRDLASTVTFVTGHEDPSKADSSIDWAHLARLRGTKIFLMGVERLGLITGCLIEQGAEPTTPVALVRWGTTARQETLTGTLSTIADLVARADFRAPAVIIVGEVVSLRSELNWYEALPLLGKRIVVTRTRRQASALAELLSRQGADVLEIPTIEIVSVPLEDSAQSNLQNIASKFDWLVFTSPNAVEFFFAEFLKIHSDLRALGEIRIAVVGPATARKINDLHLRVDLKPENYTAVDLAQAFTPALINGARFCLPRSRKAGSELGVHLRARGGVVDEWILYDTLPALNERSAPRARFLKEGAHAIIFASSSSAENWHELKLEPAIDAPHPKVVSMGPATSEMLRSLHYEIAVQAEEATLDSVLAAVKSLSDFSAPSV